MTSSSLKTKFTVVKRNGQIVPFKKERIYHAIESAFKDTRKAKPHDALPEDIIENIREVCNLVVKHVQEMATKGSSLTVEGIQDLVEVTLMELGFHDVARDYIIYRDKRSEQRDSRHSLELKIMREGHDEPVRFNPIKIASSLEKIARVSDLSEQKRVDIVNLICQKVVSNAIEKAETELLTTKFIQDEIERQLMQEGYFELAKAYILKRATKSLQPKEEKTEAPHPSDEKPLFNMVTSDGKTKKLYRKNIRKKMAYVCKDFPELNAVEELTDASVHNLYDGIKESEIDASNIMAARVKMEKDPAFSKIAARLLLDSLYREIMGADIESKNLEKTQRDYFKKYIKLAIDYEFLDPKLLEFDLDLLSKALDFSRDDQFEYLGLRTLYDRYFIHKDSKRLESPQIFWMRVAMGLSLNEENKNEMAVEFYHILSQFLYVSSTPTLFNSATRRSQLSSCFLSTVQDDLEDIFRIISDDAKLSKWAGGLGNDWTNVRATGSLIKGTNGKGQGVIPFLKVANDTAVAVNQGGKRKGALCCYLETWHLDIEDFLELRKNTGDERRRTHDMNTANWIPDLFMKRVMKNEKWTLFTPSDVPDLHDLYGKAFEKRYVEYEKMAKEGKIKLFKEVEALQLWRKMLGMLFETGHPWITFKDPSNIRSPQDHVGVVHSSNLCTEILLNTSKEETAVCNLGSVNLIKHLKKDGSLDRKKLQTTVTTAIRMLDNVIDINFYPIPQTKNANSKHRPIGLGLMGFQDLLYANSISTASQEAVELADEVMELISYHAILASSQLAKEKGTYETYKGSKWDRGLLPIDTLDLLEKERGEYIELDKSSKLDWTPVRESIKKYGMRNSNTMAIAPTATIANIVGVTASIEPTYKHLYAKSNLSGEFVVLNPFLVDKLKELNIWDEDMIDDLKYFDGSIQEIERIPEKIKQIFLTSFEIDPDWLIESASRRQKWIDMGQSLNLYLGEPSGKKMHEMYTNSWMKGLKTNYYFRSLGATQIEKSTTDINKRRLQPRWMKSESPTSRIQVDRSPSSTPVCNLDEGCESCQ